MAPSVALLPGGTSPSLPTLCSGHIPAPFLHQRTFGFLVERDPEVALSLCTVTVFPNGGRIRLHVALILLNV